ncbi:MAG: dihydropteroate synthase [Microbacteriaceae bacterium]
MSDPSARPLIMGVLNVTPDSFSDGGLYDSTEAAVDHAVALVAAGASVIDVGGESTRPGAQPIDAETEQERVLPVIVELVKRGIRVSVDTSRASTAAAAVEAGAEFVNDVSGGLADDEMYREIARNGATYIAMHSRGASDNVADYGDVVTEVRTELRDRLAELIVWGVDPDKIIVDPGLGFSKTAEHNWTLLGHLDDISSLGFAVLVGASRKRFLGELLDTDATAEDRDAPTATISALAAQSGVWGVRVHNVAATAAALDVWERWEKGARS